MLEDPARSPNHPVNQVSSSPRIFIRDLTIISRSIYMYIYIYNIHVIFSRLRGKGLGLRGYQKVRRE